MSFYVTTPIYYVNAAPHLGHAYTTIGADILARHMRQRGEDVFFLTGTDEHGEPVAQAAEREGVTPRELADRNAERFKALMPQIEASNDFFIRTSDPEHGERVQAVLQRVYDNGHVYKGLYEGWYCPRCADFKTESEIGPGNTCPIHFIPLDWRVRGELLLPPLDLPGAARAPLRGAPGLRHAAGAPQRGALVHHGRAPGRLAHAARSSAGASRCRGTSARLLRLVRRAAQLLHGARLRARRRGPDRALLAGDVPHHRQGHPQVPRGVLAGDADGRGHRGPAARLRPRLPALQGLERRGRKMSKSLGNVLDPSR